MLNMTPCAIGGLRRFQVPEDWEQQQGNDCLDWPCQLVSADQGPNSWCAQAWLESPCHGRLNMVREPDAHNHGVHNDTLVAVLGIGFGSFLNSATVALNIHFCSEMMVRSARRSSKPLAPSGSSVRPHILSSYILQKSSVTRRACLDHRLHQTAANTLSGAGSCHKSGQKVVMCRWFQVFLSSRRLFGGWTSLLVVLWMSASVFHWNTAKLVELEAGMPGFEEKGADEIQRDGRT